MIAGIGHNNPPPDDPPVEPEVVTTAQIVLRCVEVLASALGMFKYARAVLRKKQGVDVISVRQLTVYCLTYGDESQAIVPVVELSRIIGFDRGTVRDDKKAVEVAIEADDTGELQDFLDTARDMVMAVPVLSAGRQRYMMEMELARAKSRTRQRKLQEMKRQLLEALSKPTRAEIAFLEIHRPDLAAQQAQRRKEPFNPLTEGRLARLCNQ